MLIPINEIRVMVHSCDKGSQLAKNESFRNHFFADYACLLQIYR